MAADWDHFLLSVINEKIIGWHQTVGKPLAFGFYFENELNGIKYRVFLVKGWFIPGAVQVRRRRSCTNGSLGVGNTEHHI